MKDVIIILQARSNSNRLPKKVLKKIKGIPLVILCAKRLMNKGCELIVATSKKKTDDKLCEILENNSIKFFRGSLNNVFSRYYKISRKYPKKKFIVRATADNPVPDGNLVNILIHTIKNKKLNYLGINHKIHNLPHGISLEIFNKKKLQSLLNKKLTKYDLEHVTPKMYNFKGFKNTFIKKLKIKKNLADLNVSIDKKKDFILVNNLLKKIKNPLKANWKNIIYYLDKCSNISH